VIAQPVIVRLPMRRTTNVVFASAHSGQDYPAQFLAQARLPLPELRRSEDSFVDTLFAAAPEHGAPLVCATFGRAFCDANREAWELDAAMFEGQLPAWVNTTSPRVAAGLGTIARIVASGEPIYRGKLAFSEAEQRIAQYWQPFHDALGAQITLTRQQFGRCLLLDCHSMPALSQPPRDRADVVLGDAHGTSCRGDVARQVEQALTQLGLRVRRNDPYAGGYITRHYGRPREGVDALQIELCRTLYMDEQRIAPLERFAAIQARITRLIAELTAPSA